MFTAFMNLTIFFLIYLLYRYIKSRIYDYLDKEPVSSRREWLILPVALFMFAFVATSGFTRYNVSSGSVSIPFALPQLYSIPFKELYLNWKNYEFYNAIFGQTNTFYNDIFVYQIKDYIRLFTSMLALGFVISIVNKTFIKSLIAMSLIRLLLGLLTGESHFATSLCLALIAFLIAFVIYKLLYRELKRKNFLETFAQSPIHRTFVIGYLIVMCLLPLYFVDVDTQWAPDKWSSSQYIDFKEPSLLKTYEDKVDLSIESFRIINEDALELEFFVSGIPPLEIPYKTTITSIDFKFEIGGEIVNHGSGNYDGGNRMHLTLANIAYPYQKGRNQSIYPLKLFGISSIGYTIDDKRFTNQMQVLDTKWWTNEDGYDCYTYTYQVPKVEGYEINVGSTITYDNPYPKKDFQTFENKAWAISTNTVKVDSTDAFDIYSVDNYFYDFEKGPLEKSQIHGLEQDFYMTTVRVDVQNIPKEPIWTIDSIDYFKPYLE